MSPVAKPLIDALDALDAPVDLFIRDDDGGWDDDRLAALLGVVEPLGVPIDLALIPDATTPALAAELRARFDAAGGRLGLHQHGRSHRNHETQGRRCEFGAARDAKAQRDDLRAGRQRLRGLLGDRLDDVFTPPWNRCADTTPALLAELGFAALSRDRTAPSQRHLPELPVHVDWSREVREAVSRGDEPGPAVAAALARQVHAGGRVGLMLHHAAMDGSERRWLGEGLQAWARHPMARFRPMRDLLATAQSTGDGR